MAQNVAALNKTPNFYGSPRIVCACADLTYRKVYGVFFQTLRFYDERTHI